MTPPRTQRSSCSDTRWQSRGGKSPARKPDWADRAVIAALARVLLSLCRAKNSHMASLNCFPCSLACSPVLADQAVNDLSAADAGGHIDRPVDLVLRASLFAQLVRPVFVVMLRILGQDPPEVPFAIGQQVVEALAA